MKVILVLATLVSALLVALAGHQARPVISKQDPAPPLLRIVRSPQAPKIVRPVHPAAMPVSTPAHHLGWPATCQHKA